MKYLIAILLVISISVCSCAKKMTFNQSTIVPAATGQVVVKKDNNRNYAISIQVLNLAEPQRLSPAKSTYIVWMESSQASAKKLGQINTSSGLLSKALKASLNTATTTEPIRIFITAEDNADVDYPIGPQVLTKNAR